MWLIWQRKRPHYAWVILICVMVVMGITAAFRFSFGVMIDSLVAEHGWSRGAVSFTYSLQFIIGIPVVIAAGHLAEKIGSRRIVIVGAVISMVGILLTATVTQLWQLQLYFGIIIGGGSATFVTLLPVLLTRWFNKKLGLALGLFWASQSLGPAILSPLIRWALETIGWSETFVILGLVSGTLMLVFTFLLRDHPQQKNLTPYGSPDIGAPLIDTDSPVEPLRLRQLIVKTNFWSLIAVHNLGCISHSVLLAHMVSMATFAGIPGLAASGVLSIVMVISLVSRLGIPIVAEAKGARFTLVLVLLLQTLPILILLSARKLWSFYTFALLFGLGFGGETVGFPIFNRQYYGKDAPLNAIYSYQMAGANLGMALGGWLGGTLFDLTGVYTWSVLAAVGAGFFGVAAALVLPSHRR